MTTPVFESRDPREPGFWSERFEQRFMPWDRAGVPQDLQRFVAQAQAPLATLIPGCGLGYEVGFLSGEGWDVCAIDFSPTAVAQARASLGPWSGRVVEADFFAFTPPFAVQLIYERAFLCALPRSMWQQVIERYAALLPAGALLAGFFFFDRHPKGPPFGADPTELEALMAPFFVRLDERAVTDSVPAFAGRERWQVWQRNGVSVAPVSAE